jgi:hypothetical protein
MHPENVQMLIKSYHTRLLATHAESEPWLIGGAKLTITTIGLR